MLYFPVENLKLLFVRGDLLEVPLLVKRFLCYVLVLFRRLTEWNRDPCCVNRLQRFWACWGLGDTQEVLYQIRACSGLKKEAREDLASSATGSFFCFLWMMTFNFHLFHFLLPFSPSFSSFLSLLPSLSLLLLPPSFSFFLPSFLFCIAVYKKTYTGLTV